MKIKKDKFFISPSDLNNFVACKYTALNEIKFHNKEIKKNEDKANDKLWKEMGIEHEKKYFQILKNKYKKNFLKLEKANNEIRKAQEGVFHPGMDKNLMEQKLDAEIRKLTGESTNLVLKNLMGNMNELSNRLFDVDETLKKVASVFPSEDEMESLDWLLRR